ncbi:MAG TPA: HAD-IIIA family hydrolase, partial [Puia sp.]|nr:HAD-IIIA family hydrolase [Puia sp.]
MNLLNEFKPITTFVFDVDGVLTDGTILVFSDGEQVRRMSIKDGYALQLAVKKGFRILVISGSLAEGVKDRLKKLGINDVYLQIENKKKKLEEYMRQHKLNWEEILFMGDDIPDFAVMRKAGLSAAPADAASEIKHIAKYISPYKGGEGCVRDVIEKVLK